MELNGNIFDFCQVAEAHLTDKGRFCFSFASPDQRPELAVAEAGLCVLAKQDVIFREGDKPVIALYTCGRSEKRCDPPPLTTRRVAGQRTDEFRRIRVEMLIEA